MDIIEFCEKICGVKLLEWQKKYLKRSYENKKEPITPSPIMLPQNHLGFCASTLLIDEFVQEPSYTIDEDGQVRFKEVSLIPKSNTTTENFKMEKCKHYNKHLDTIKAYINCLYRLEGCCTGGLLHILLDDDNIEDHHIQWCLEECEKHPEEEESEIGKLICKEYLKLTMPERRLLFHNLYLYTGGCDRDCKNCFVETGEESTNY